jgi:hypothetical protein
MREEYGMYMHAVLQMNRQNAEVGRGWYAGTRKNENNTN